MTGPHATCGRGILWAQVLLVKCNRMSEFLTADDMMNLGANLGGAAGLSRRAIHGSLHRRRARRIAAPNERARPRARFARRLLVRHLSPHTLRCRATARENTLTGAGVLRQPLSVAFRRHSSALLFGRGYGNVVSS